MNNIIEEFFEAYRVSGKMFPYLRQSHRKYRIDLGNKICPFFFRLIALSYSENNCNMNHPFFYKKLPAMAVLTMGLFLTTCERETNANGIVTDARTGAPIAGAHVMEIAVGKKSQHFLCEGYTDSTGYFEIDAGLAGFGLRRVELQIIVEKDSFRPAVSENNYQPLNIRIHRN
jgi:hypothetical protein